MIASAITYTDASRLFEADFTSGKIFWKHRTPDMFGSCAYSAERRCKAWNTNFAGKEAFTAANSGGYKHGTIFGKKYKAHRVLWLLYTGEWPRTQIDHINGDCADNRIANLRDVPQAENCKNQRCRKDNSSGVVGVSWHKQTGKWLARIGNGRGGEKYIGLFRTFEDAVAARYESEAIHGFHQNHGRN